MLDHVLPLKQAEGLNEMTFNFLGLISLHSEMAGCGGARREYQHVEVEAGLQVPFLTPRVLAGNPQHISPPLKASASGWRISFPSCGDRTISEYTLISQPYCSFSGLQW